MANLPASIHAASKHNRRWLRLRMSLPESASCVWHDDAFDRESLPLVPQRLRGAVERKMVDEEFVHTHFAISQQFNRAGECVRIDVRSYNGKLFEVHLVRLHGNLLTERTNPEEFNGPAPARELDRKLHRLRFTDAFDDDVGTDVRHVRNCLKH